MQQFNTYAAEPMLLIRFVNKKIFNKKKYLLKLSIMGFLDELDAQSEELTRNNTCTFRNEEPHVVSFFNDLEITETVDFSPGATIVSR